MKRAFLFQGQGGFHPEAVKTLIARPELAPFVDRADAIVHELYSTRFSDWLRAPQASGQQSVEQVGIFLEGFLAAQHLLHKDVRPDFVMGHSFGEFSALAVADVVSLEDAIRLVHARSVACEPFQDVGAMMVIAADEMHVASLLAALGNHSLEISVLNHPAQTVVSGTRADLHCLKHLAMGLEPSQRVSTVMLGSRFPFHSSLLANASHRFGELARDVAFRPATCGLYLPVERETYGEQRNMAALLAAHLVTRFNFMHAIDDLLGLGVRDLTECGGSATLRNLVRRIPDARLASTTLTGALDPDRPVPPVSPSPPSLACRTDSRAQPS